jgi:uncharacterized protein (TIGR02001 family)
MKKLILMLAAVLLTAGTLVPTQAMAIEASADAYVGVYSAYIWRGFNLSEDDAFVVQPGADVTINGFTVSWWGNLSENNGELNEVDLTLDYTLSVTDKISLSVGNIMYDVDADGGPDTTNEVYLGVAVDTLLSPSATIYVDYDEFETVFATLGGSYGFDLQKGLSLGLGANLGIFLDDGADESFLHNLELSASADYALTEQVTLGALVLASFPISDDADDIIDDEVTAGVSATFAF